MKLKNILLAVENIEDSKVFYRKLFGLRTVVELEGQVILTEGLVLQERRIWNELLGKENGVPGELSELYFEETDFDAFLQKLEQFPEPVRCLHSFRESDGGERLIRLYDPDGHLIEVRERKRR